MKHLLLFLAGLSCVLVTTPSFASFFEACDVTAEVISIEEVSVFGKGSVSLPAVDGDEDNRNYTFMNILTIEVIEVEDQDGHSDCQDMEGKSYRVVIDSKENLDKIKLYDELELTRTQHNSMTSGGVAYTETWKLQELLKVD